MIDLYTWGTPNGRKISIMLEELGMPYEIHTVNIRNGEQFKPDFLAISPNGKIPAIVDREVPDGKSYSLFESGAILMYLAEKIGSNLFPKETLPRYKVMEWLMFQMASVGPIFGQTHHFLRAAPDIAPYAAERYMKETARLYSVMDKRLSETQFLAGDYSIADIATYPWVSRHEWQNIKLEDFSSVKRWFEVIGSRPAVQRGMDVPKM